MNQQDIAAALKRIAAPEPGPEAKLRAKRAALAEFARSQAANQPQIAPDARVPNNLFQVLWHRLRPSRDNSHGSGSMNRFVNRGLFAGAAGVCVVALGITMVWPNLSRDVTDVGREQPVETPAPPPVEVDLRASPDAPAEMIVPPRVDAAPPTAAPPPVESRQQAPFKPESQRAVVGPTRAPPVVLRAEPASEAGDDVENIVVTGMRASVKTAMETKREAVVAVDAIQAEDIGKFPDMHAAESLQRMSGISIAGNQPLGKAATEQEHYQEQGRDRFQRFEVNPIRRVADEPVSTFSADVDTASYSFVRAQLNFGRLPQKDAVRSEEMINYFDYAWPAASSRNAPFKPTVVVGDSPWNQGRKLVHIGIKGYELRGEAPDANLVLLLDVSGSMNAPNKLPLAVRSMEILLDSLKPGDTVGIVVYAGAAGTVLEPTPVRERSKILEALRSLRPGGSTAGAEGIERAYELAQRSFRKGGVNRILLATDGDFNVGIDSTDELKGFVERKREQGVYLSVLGFGQGNYRDELAQALAQNGNGVAAYIDTESEARKVLVQEANASLFTIAKDVKLQVEFNPATVSEYRLVGYETRALRREDFNNDAIDAGDVGAGHTVTAIYEITPVGARQSVDEPYFESNRRPGDDQPRAKGNLYGFLKIRYKLPSENESRLLSEAIPLRSADHGAAVSRDVAFSTAVAGFAQLLRGGAYTGRLTFDDVIRQAESARGEDRFGHRAEFIELVRKAKSARGM
jgi:Ca-activated chloride channel family protein